jgi:DNA-binding NtrC family response regulator
MSASVGKQISSAAPSKGTILCVDSYPTLLPTVEVLLNQLGYKALTASSVDEGLSHLSQNRVAVVILDYTLCEHDHHSVTCVVDQIRAVQPDIKVIVWCADDSVLKESLPCADAVFIKPVDPQKLVNQLDSLLGDDNIGT